MPSNTKHTDGTTGSSSKLHRTESKNRARNRRRNRRKRKQQSQLALHQQIKPTTTNSKNETQLILPPSATSVNRNHGVGNAGQEPTSSSASSSSTTNRARNHWYQHYNNAVRWQAQYQMEYWKHLAERRKLEMDLLQSRIDDLEKEGAGAAAVQTHCEDDSDDQHESYLQFLEISTRHQIQKKIDKTKLDKMFI